MVTYMEKTTLYLEADAYSKLKRLAAARRCPPAALVREAVAEYVARHGRTALPASLGAATSGRTDLSERAEDLLEGLGTPRPRRRRDRR